MASKTFIRAAALATALATALPGWARPDPSTPEERQFFAFVQTQNFKNLSRVLDERPGLIETRLPGNGWTALHLNVDRGRIKSIKYLLARRANVNAQDATGATPLLLAIRLGNAGIAQILLEAGADLDVPDAQGITSRIAAGGTADALRTLGPDAINPALGLLARGDLAAFRAELAQRPGLAGLSGRRGTTLLHEVARRNLAPLVPDLVAAGARLGAMEEQPTRQELENAVPEAGADIEHPDTFNPLHVAAAAGATETVTALLAAGANPAATAGFGDLPLAVALQHGRAGVVRLLRTKPDGPWRQFNIYHQTLLFPAARFGDPGIVQDLILRGLDPLQVDDEGRTPLFYAGSRTVVRLLLSKGDDPKRRDKAGATVLFTVSDPGAAEALLAAGAPRGVEDEHGRTALDVQKKDHPDVAVVLQRRGGKGGSAIPKDTNLIEALMEGNEELAERIVAQDPDVVRRDLGGATALCMTVPFMGARATGFLLLHGASARVTCEGGWTLLQMARDAETAKVLLAAGLKPDPLALVTAAGDARADVVAVLLEAGVPPGARTGTGPTALHAAAGSRRQGTAEVARMLLQKGASPTARWQGKTPLETAVDSGNDAVAAVLRAPR